MNKVEKDTKIKDVTTSEACNTHLTSDGIAHCDCEDVTPEKK